MFIHIVDTYLSLTSCTQNFVKNTLTEPPAPKMHVHKPRTANTFWGQMIEEEQFC